MKFHRRILSDGPVRTTVQVDLDGFETNQNRYDIRERFSIYANGHYSENSISIHPAKSSTSIGFSLGFAKLRGDEYFFDSASGYFGSWGRQNNTVREIGQAAIFRKRAAILKQDAKQRDVVFTVPPGETSTYYRLGTGGADGCFRWRLPLPTGKTKRVPWQLGYTRPYTRESGKSNRDSYCGIMATASISTSASPPRPACTNVAAGGCFMSKYSARTARNSSVFARLVT